MGNEGSLLQPILLLLCLIVISAGFSCAEISLLTVNRNKLENLVQKGSKKAGRLSALINEPAKFLATIQVGNTVTGFLASAFAADIFSARLTGYLASAGIKLPMRTLNSISVVAIILVLSYFTMVLSELVPKRVAMKKADTLAFFFSGPLRIISVIFSPVVWLLTRSTNAVLRLFKIDPVSAGKAITEEEIRMMVDLGSVGGAINSSEQEIIHNVFEFGNKNAGDVMTHRRDVIFLNLDESDSDWDRIITSNRRNLFPVCGKGPDDIKGILNTRDYLILKDKIFLDKIFQDKILQSGSFDDGVKPGENLFRESILKILRPARFVPLTVSTDKLFLQMKKSRDHFAVTVDEFGSMMGIITMNDLLEELVGDLENDNTVPADKPLIEKINAGEWYINGAVPLDIAAGELDMNLPVAKYDTFAGFVFSLLGHIPEDGSREELEFTPDETAGFGPLFLSGEHAARVKLVITLLEIREHRLERALVRKIT